MKELLRLVSDDRGQDLVEYGLLVAVFATVAVAIFPVIVTGMGTLFGNGGTAANAISEAPAPK